MYELTARRTATLALAALFGSQLLVAQSPEPLGGEFHVNTFTPGFQGYPAVASDADGNFVVTWDSYGHDGSGSGVFAQRFDAAGTPHGPEFQVNTTTADHQRALSVGSAAGGGFVVVWSSADQDGDSHGVFGQRFDVSGAPQASEFLVNTYTTGSQYVPVVGVAPDGDFVVVWQSEVEGGGLIDIFARRFDASGLPLAAEFQVNEYTGSFQVKPAVAVDADGDFVVAWESLYQDGGSAGVFTRRFDSAGVAQAGEFQVNSYTPGDQYDPTVAADADGDFVIAWTRFDGGAAGVAAQRFDSGGAPQGIEFLVNTSTMEYQHRPVVIMRGGFVVVWQSYGQDGEQNGVFARSFDSTGAPQTAELQVNTHTANHQSNPAAALSGNGDLVVAWDSGAPGEFDVVAQRFATLAVLDIDGNGTTGALTDGLLVLRFLFGLDGNVLINAVVGPGCTRCDATSIEAYLQSLI